MPCCTAMQPWSRNYMVRKHQSQSCNSAAVSPCILIRATFTRIISPLPALLMTSKFNSCPLELPYGGRDAKRKTDERTDGRGPLLTRRLRRPSWVGELLTGEPVRNRWKCYTVSPVKFLFKFTEKWKMIGTWLGEIRSCSCLAVLLDSAWVLLNKIYQPFFTSLYVKSEDDIFA